MPALPDASAAAEALSIDARNPSLDPATPLLGLSLLRRLVLAARRAGFSRITVVAADESARARLGQLLRGIREAEARVVVEPATADGLTISADQLGEVHWLKALRAGEVQPDALTLATPSTLVQARARLLKALVKDTDGFMSRRFARPLSIAVSRRIVGFGITPNQMTFVCMLFGLAAAPFFLFERPALQAIGGLLFVAHSVLDGCDGELARLTYRESRFGGLFDFGSDNLVHVAIFGCMAWGWHAASGSAVPLVLGTGAVLGTVGSAFAVYWLTMRAKDGDDAPLYTSVAATPQQSKRLTGLLDDLSRRDFIYLVFALSLFGKAAWFLALAGVGAPIFLVLVLVAAWRGTR